VYQVCSVLDSLEREYRREEDFCGSANASVNHVIGIILDHKSNREKIVLTLDCLIRWKRKIGCHASTDSPPSRTKRKLSQSMYFYSFFVAVPPVKFYWYCGICFCSRLALLLDVRLKPSSSIPVAAFSFTLWRVKRVIEALNKELKVRLIEQTFREIIWRYRQLFPCFRYIRYFRKVA
jgi:hypothetical protein